MFAFTSFVLEVPAREIKQEKKIIESKLEIKKQKLSLFVNDMVLYIEHPRGAWVARSVKHPPSV